MLLSRWILGVLLLLFATAASAQVEVPQLLHRVTDLTATLSPEQTNALEAKLAAFEAGKGSQIAVLIVATTQPEDIAQFGIRVADAWKIGRKGVDDGVILIVAKDDRKLRLEVGYGLEGVIPDAVAKRVTSEIIKPYFKAGDFAGGIDAGVSQLIKLIEGEPLPAPEQTEREAPNSDAFMFVLVGGIIVGSVLSLILGRLASGIVAGLGSGLVAAWVFGMVIIALLIAIIVFIITGLFYPDGRGPSDGSRGGGFWGGGGSWGSGGGSWSGGGGGFGGGGASDSW